MKVSSKLMFSFLMLLLGVSSIYAQRPDRGSMEKLSPEEMAQKQTERLSEALELSETQYSQVYNIALEFLNKKEALRENSTDREAMRESSKQLREEEKTALKAVLTEAQIVKLDAMKEEMQDKRGSRERGGRRGGRN